MLRGTLDEFSLSDIVGLIAGARKTGILELSGAAGSGRLYFSDGAICGARCARGREPLGRKLVRAGVVTEPQLASVLARKGEIRLRLGDTLVGEGLAGLADIADALKDQVEESVVALLELQPSDFEWRPEAPEEQVVAIGAGAFLRGIEERLSELADIRARIPSDDMIVTLSSVPPTEPSAATISGEEWRVISLLGARRSVRDLLQYARSGELDSLRIIDRLLTSGVLEVSSRVRPGTPTPPTPPAGIRVEGVPRRRVIDLSDAPPPPLRPETDVFRIVLVSTSDCTRGPLTAALLRHATRGLPVAVSSYGIKDLAGAPPTEAALAAARRTGVDLSHHRSRWLAPGAAAEADLVVGLEPRHADAAVGWGKARRQVTFTLVELLALLGELDPQGLSVVHRGRLLVGKAHMTRAGTPPRESLPPDMPEAWAAREIAPFLADSCNRLSRALFGEGTEGE